MDSVLLRPVSALLKFASALALSIALALLGEPEVDAGGAPSSS